MSWLRMIRERRRVQMSSGNTGLFWMDSASEHKVLSSVQTRKSVADTPYGQHAPMGSESPTEVSL